MYDPLWLKEMWGAALSLHFDYQTYNNIKIAPQRFGCGEIWFVIIMASDLFFLPKPHGLKSYLINQFSSEQHLKFFLHDFFFFFACRFF